MRHRDLALSQSSTFGFNQFGRDHMHRVQAADLDITVAAIERAGLGESPVWSQRERSVYWIDSRSERIFRLEAPGLGSDFPPLRVEVPQ